MATRRRLTVESREDLIQEAYVALLNEWPTLAARFDDVPLQMVTMVVHRRLIDFTRRELGRSTVGRRDLRPHIGAISIDAVRRRNIPRSDSDVEREALCGIDVERDIARYCRQFSVGAKRDKVSRLLHAIAQGRTLHDAAREGGFTVNYADVLMSEVRRTLRATPAGAA